MDEELEQTLLIVKQCFVYKLPPRTTAAGYRAAEWDLSAPMWTGRLSVKGKGETCLISLEDANTGEIFATCPYSEPAVEAVNDSSRYFVLRIEDGQGRHAFIGIGFAERTEAFDFQSSLQDHRRYVKQAKEAEEAVKRLESTPAKDYRLPEGTTIRVNIPSKKDGGATAASTSKQNTSSSSSSSTGGLFGLPPPPRAASSASSPRGPPPSSSSSSSSSSASMDFLGGFSNAPSSSQTKNSSALDDLWTDFTGGSSQSNQQASASSTSSIPSDWVAFQ